jgi:hypothetical protein
MKQFYCVCDGLTLKDKVKCVAEDEEFKAKCDEKFTDCDACMILQDLIEGGLSHEDCEYYKLYEPIKEELTNEQLIEKLEQYRKILNNICKLCSQDVAAYQISKECKKCPINEVSDEIKNSY